uniref:Pericentrin-like protein n=1 Tax=Marsilea vestita TaxID=59764 RepID=I6XTI4_MARVE|nr:pericentrin-like protein [Marsilea vestita]
MSLQNKVSKESDGECVEETNILKDLLGRQHGQPISNSNNIEFGSKQEEQDQLSSLRSNKAITICWKWRWVAAASEAQALSKELENIKSLGLEFLDKSTLGSLQYTMGQEKFRSSMLNSTFQTKDLLNASQSLSFEKVFSLMSSIWQTSSHSAYLEKELMIKKRKYDHLFHALESWVQKNLKMRRMERAIIRWLAYLLQSRKAKTNQAFTQDSSTRVSPRSADDAKNNIRASITSMSRSDTTIKKVACSVDRDAQISSMKTLFLLKVSPSHIINFLSVL